MALLLLGFLHLCTENMLHDDSMVSSRFIGPIGALIINVVVVVCNGIFILNIRGADVTPVISNNVCPFAQAFPLDMANPLALMAANLRRCTACGSNRGGALGRHRLRQYLATCGTCGGCCYRWS